MSDEKRGATEFVSIAEAAAILGVSIDTVRRWEKNGKLNAHRSAGGHRMFAKSDLTSFRAEMGLSISEAAARLNISPSTLRRWEKEGRITAQRNDRGERIYTQEQLNLVNSTAAIPRVLDKTERSYTKPIIKNNDTTSTKSILPQMVLRVPTVAQSSVNKSLHKEKNRHFNLLPAVASLIVILGVGAAGVAAFQMLRSGSEGSGGNTLAVLPVSAGEGTGRVLALVSSDQERFFQVNIPAYFEEGLTTTSLVTESLRAVPGLTTIDAEGTNIDFGSGTVEAANLVYSVQGERGDVTLEAGEGITIVGTTISSSASTTLTGAGDITITETSEGVFTLALESTLDKVSVINLAANGTLNGLDAIDATTKSTLEEELELTGDVTGTLDAVEIADNAVTLGDKTEGDYVKSVSAGNGGVSVSGSGESATVAVSVDVVTTGTTATTSSNSGLEIGSDGLRLLGGCSDEDILKWDTATNTWLCDAGTGSSSFTLASDSGSSTIANGDTLTVTGGNGVTTAAATDTLTITMDLLDSADGAGGTSSNSGLEFGGAGSDEVSLLQGCGDNEILAWNDSSTIWECSSVVGAGGFSSFTVAAESGSSQTITDGNTLTITAGTGINTVASATDTVTVSVEDDSLDFAQLQDSLDVDAATTITLGSNNLTFTNDSTGEFQFTGLSSSAGTTLCLDGSNNLVTCASGSSSATLQSAYDAGNTITTTDGRNISITLDDTTTDQTFEITQTGTANAFEVNDDGTLTDSTPFVVDASGQVGIGDSSPDAKLDVSIDDSGTDSVTDTLILEHTSSGTPAAGLGTGLSFHIEDAGGSEEQGSIDVSLSDVTDASEDAIITLSGNVAGAITELAHFDGTESVINDASLSMDLRVEGDANANLFFVDASADSVGIGDSTPDAQLDVLSDGTGKVGLIVQGASGQTANTLEVYDGSGNLGFAVAPRNTGNGTIQDIYISNSNGTHTLRMQGTTFVIPGTLNIGGSHYSDGAVTYGGSVQILTRTTVGGSTGPRLGGTDTNTGIRAGSTDVAIFSSSTTNLLLNSSGASIIPLTVKGAASQSANLLELQESDGSIFLASGDGLASSEFVINEQGEDIDFRIEGVGSSSALFVQGSDGNVGIGDSSPDAKLDVSIDDSGTDSVTDLLILEHTSSGTPAAGLGTGLSFHVEDAGGSEEQGSIDTVLTTVTDGSEDSDIVFSVQQAGTMTELLRLDGSADSVVVAGSFSASDFTCTDCLDFTELEDTLDLDASLIINTSGNDITFNEDSGDSDFRIESDGSANMFFLDASANTIGIGTATPGYTLQVVGTVAAAFDGGVSARSVQIKTISSGLGRIVYEEASGVFEMQVAGTSAHLATGSSVGSYTDRFTVDSSGIGVFNESGVSTADLRVEGDTDINLLFTDASADAVGIGDSTPDAKLDISLDNSATDAVSDVLILEHTSSGTPAAGLGTGLSFHVEDAGGSEEQASIDVVLTTVTDASEDADVVFTVNQSGTMTELVRLDASADNLVIAGGLTATGVVDFGGATSTEIVNGTAPTVDAAGEVAIDTNTDNTNITHGSLVFYDGTSTRYIPSVATIPSDDGYVLAFDSGTNSFVFEAGGAGASTLQDAYDGDANGSDATIALTTADDSLVVSNPSSSGTDSAYAFLVDQNATGAVAGISVDDEGTGLALDVNDAGDADVIDVIAEHTTFANDIVVLQANEEDTGTFNFLKLISDADNTPDTELTINQDGDITTDGVISAAGVTSTGVVDFGGATSTEITNGTGPTVDAAGEIAVDTTDGQIQYYDGTAARTLTYKKQFSTTLESPSDADNFNLLKAPYALTITSIQCVVDPGDTGESAVITVQERDGDGDSPAGVDGATTITCANTNTADDGSLSNAAIDSGDWISLDIGTITGTVTQLTVTVNYTVDGI